MPENFKCTNCGEEFDSERGLHIHESQVHEEETGGKKETDQEKTVSEDNKVISLGLRSALVSVFVLGILVGFSSGMVFSNLNNTSLSENNTQKSAADQNSKTTLEGVELTGEPSLGPKDANIKLIEYSDYGCPWCAEWSGFNAIPQRSIDKNNNFEKIKNNYIKKEKIEFIYKDFPAHPNSLKAHKAANCVSEQSKDSYWNFHNKLYQQRDNWMKSGQDNPEETFKSIAKQEGVNSTIFFRCYKNSNGEEVKEDLRNIRSIQQIGTPTFFIGNRELGFTKISGAQPYQRISQIIDSKLSQ